MQIQELYRENYAVIYLFFAKLLVAPSDFEKSSLDDVSFSLIWSRTKT